MLGIFDLSAHVGTMPVLKGVGFSLERGETLAVLGASGSGKSLTARAVIGLPPRGISYGGRVVLNGRDLLALTERERTSLRGRVVSMIFQEPATALNPVMRIGTQIAEPLRIHTDVSPAERRARVDELLEATGLSAAGVGAERYPHELSGGQRQRVAVAIAIALRPQLVVADEPTSALDAVSAAQVLDLLFQLTSEVGAAVILITHDIAVARRAGRTLVMDRGTVSEEGATETILAVPQSKPAQALVRGSAIKLPPRTSVVGKTILTARGIDVVRGSVHAVAAADLTVNAGERLAIVGSSGSGKTSLSRALVGLIPSGGEVSLDGRTVATTDPALRRAVQLVFQDPATSFNPRHKVGRIVTEPLFGSALTAAEKADLAEKILTRVGLPGVQERKPHAFSGGQRQRMAIARALVGGPRVLIADEAVSALDAALRADVIKLLDDLTAREAIALVFIAHDLGLVRTLADRIVVMSKGRIVEDGPADRVFSNPRSPETMTLLEAASGHGTLQSATDGDD
ncbi:MAG: ABC transporter ATP-binding protein [Pseudomonadota bacterium]